MWDTPIRAAPQRSLWDEKKAAEAFTIYYNDRELCKKHGENARKHAIKYCDWEPVGKKWLQWITKVAK
jgi:hypothetical protein